MKYITKVFLISLLLSPLEMRAQTWAGLSTYGGANYDEVMGLDFIGDTPAFLLSTISYSISGLDEDFLMMVPGTPAWKKVIGQGGGLDDWPYKVAWQTTGNIVVGGAYCYDGGSGPGACVNPQWAFLLQLSPSGAFIRARSLDAAAIWGPCTAPDRQTNILSVWPTNDGGIVAAGFLTYGDYDIYGNCVPADIDAFIAKFDSNLNLQWMKVLWTVNSEQATTAIQTTDGNYVLLAPSFYEVWIGKFNPSGNLLWQKRYPRSIAGSGIYYSWGKPTSDGGFILATEMVVAGYSDRDILFIKFDSYGNIQYAKSLWTTNDDVGIDVVEGPNYYWMTGFFNTSDLFVAAFDKTTGNLNRFRYILSSWDEFGGAIDISPGGLPWVGGNTNNPAWSSGNYDALVAVDTGLVDTCYWRSYPINWYDVSLSTSGSWNVFNFPYTPSSMAFNIQDVTVNANIICGLTLGNDDELSVSERYVDCTLNYFLVGNELRIRVKGKTDLDISLYTVDGRKLFSKHLEGFSGIYRVPVKLEKGVYMLDLKHGGGRTTQKIVVK